MLGELLRGGFLTVKGFAHMAVRIIPLCPIGLGNVSSFRAGVFNIGSEGQLLIGACWAMDGAPYLAQPRFRRVDQGELLPPLER